MKRLEKILYIACGVSLVAAMAGVATFIWMMVLS